MLKVNIKMIDFIHLFQTGMVERKGENDFNKYTRLLWVYWVSGVAY